MFCTRQHWCSWLLTGLLAWAGGVCASGLQVSPVSLNLKADRNADGLWLSNTGDSVLHAQVRVYHWTQPEGDQQIPSQGLLVSPPMLKLAPGERQLVRVIRAGPAPSGHGAVEDAYRISVAELPIEKPEKSGLQFVLNYSVPVFIEPAGAPPLSPQLEWTLQRKGAQAVLKVSNTGNGHAQLSRLTWVDPNGHRVELAKGLLGYVLPNATMRWELAPAASEFVDGGNFEAAINGVLATQKVSLADRAD